MSSTTVQERPSKGASSDSGQTLPSRLTQPAPDPSASKRLCFYKSGDYTFSGHRLVVNGRTFKTFDALLDALSKKVPLPFGVRTIATPRGTHFVKALDDLHDGGSYVCSDQKRVKPLKLEEVNRRQVPWNTTRPLSGGQRRRQGIRLRQFGPLDETKVAKATERVAVRTPKRLLVIKNKDPTLKRTIVLQRRTAPTFDALLDYLSQMLQFPVLKLYSTDGRRVDGLAALILCSGVLVAAGSEPFRLGSYSFAGPGQMAPPPYGENPGESSSMPQSRVLKNKVLSSGRGSRNFSLSSERYIINQINKSQNGGHRHNQIKNNHQLPHHHTSMEAYDTGRTDTDHRACIIPHEDDIEKSFRVNQDGSMTVEMKVHLTIKREEVLHWTTTLSRTSTSKRSICASFSESEQSSPDINNAVGKAPRSVSDAESKEDNHSSGVRKTVGFNGYSSGASENTKNGFKRNSTPGPRHVNNKVSVENVKMVSESSIQESTLGHYSFMERMAVGETKEGYCIVQHSSSSRPIPIPRKTASAGDEHSNSAIRSSGVAEVLQIQNNGMEVTETVMHIYESQGCYDNYFANEDYSVESVPLESSSPAPARKAASDSGPSSSNDCDIDCSWQPPTDGSQQRQKEEMLSLSSEPTPVTCEKTINMPTQSPPQETLKKGNMPRRTKRKSTMSTRNPKGSTSTSSTDLKQREQKGTSSKNSKFSSHEKLGSDASVRKNGYISSESTKRSREELKVKKNPSEKSIQDEKLSRKESSFSVRSEPMKKIPSQRRNLNKAPARENGYNVNTPSARPQMKKNMTEFLQTNTANTSGKKKMTKPKSLTETRSLTLKKPLELADTFSMPLLNKLDNPSQDEVHQYVESWLEQADPDPVPYTEEGDETESGNKVVFRIGGDTESDEKNGCQTTSDENHLSSGIAVKKSTSCLSVPLCHQGMDASLPQNEWTTRGLCVSMPTFRVDPVHHDNRLRSHQSAEAIGPGTENDESASTNILSPKLNIKPVFKQLCSSIQCIRRATATDTSSNLEKTNSLPDFPTHVASVFGSSCKALLSFLSVMTLRDNFTGSTEGEGGPSKPTSEAKLMMESLQKISTIEDEEAQRASLTDLQSQASSQFRERWKDFVTLRERLESEPLSPRVSETEFALDVVSEGGDAFEDQQLGINELMEELNMPPELRAEINATIQQTMSFYPVEESTFIETERNPSDSEEDVEQFVKEIENQIILSGDEGPIEVNYMTRASDQEQDHTEEEDTMKEAEEEETIQEVYSDTNEILDEVESTVEPAEGTDEDKEEEEEQENETVGESAEKMEEEPSEDNEEAGEEVEEEEETTGGSISEDTDEREGAEETEEEEKMEEEEEKEIDDDMNDYVESDHITEEEEGEEEEEVTEKIYMNNDVENNFQEEKDYTKEEKEEEEEKEDVEEEEDEEEEEEEEENSIQNTHKEEENQVDQPEAGNVEDKINKENEVEMNVPEEQEKEEEVSDVDEKEEEVDEEVIKVPDEEEDDAVSEEDNKEYVQKNQSEEHEEEGRYDSDLCKGSTEAEEESVEGNMSPDPEMDGEKEEESQCIDDNEEPCLQLDIRNCEKAKEESKSCSSEDQCEAEKVNGIEVVNDQESDNGGGDPVVHPVEISQELLDFVNLALQSSSLLFTFDSRGNLRLEPDTERMLRKQQTAVPKKTQDSFYGSKRLPSPSTSDLSDYRPETSESRRYKSQESEDILSESGDEPSVPAHSLLETTQRTSRVPDLENAGSLSSEDSENKILKEVLSPHCAASSSKTPEKDYPDGVLIDQGRWLLKENHLIRTSPPASLGMYANLDSISTDASQDNNGEDSPSYLKTQHNPLAALSSSELEEMAKPQTPKCTYFNMPHGSDSDPFLDDCSIKSGKKHSRGINRNNFKVSPVVDTSKTWAKKNGSMSSFTSVEFKISDRKVHPEGESSAVSQVGRRTSSGGESVLQSRHTLDAVRLRCGQYCPIL